MACPIPQGGRKRYISLITVQLALQRCLRTRNSIYANALLWPPYGIGQAIIFSSCGFFFLLLSPFFLFYFLPLFRSCKLLRALCMYRLFLFAVGCSCVFPPSWRGAWFESDFGDVVIGQSNISHKGTCVYAERGYYLMDNAYDLFVFFTSAKQDM